MTPKIFILSASDRYNYGDLLFPIIAIKELSKHGKYNFTNVAIIKSDLSHIGALPTEKYKVLFKTNKEREKSYLLVAGGEVLGVNRSKLYSFLFPSLNWFFKFLNNIERALIKLFPIFKNPLPFTPLDKRIIKHFYFIYNSVGGKKAGPKRLVNKINQRFKQSLYLSIRDRGSKESLEKTFPEILFKLTPDSAIIMSDFYEFEKSSEYIAFQIGHYKNGGNLSLINNELKKLYQTTNWPIKFIPIGNCPGHDDIISLQWLLNNADYPCELINPDSIETIMKTIAQSRLFLGTSLHGIITAMAFSVHYLALNPSVTKLKQYVFTWAPDQMKLISPFDKIHENSISILKVNHQILLENAEYQKKLARESFKTIAELINDKSEKTIRNQ